MDPKQALQILAQASGEYKGTRQDHILVQQALGVLEAALAPAPDAQPGEAQKD